jgi:hypothetical protein
MNGFGNEVIFGALIADVEAMHHTFLRPHTPQVGYQTLQRMRRAMDRLQEMMKMGDASEVLVAKELYNDLKGIFTEDILKLTDTPKPVGHIEDS